MKNVRRAAPWIVVTLILAGVGLAGLRARARRQMQLRLGDTIWRLDYSVTFRADKAGVKLRVAAPLDTPSSRVFRQNLLYSGMAVERSRPSRSGTRRIGLSTLDAGNYTLAGRFDVHLSPKAPWRRNEPSANISAEARAAWLRAAPAIQSDSAAAQAIAVSRRSDGAKPSELARQLFDFVVSETAPSDVDGSDAGPEDAAGVLDKKRGTPLGRARALVALCRAAKLPARVVTGFEFSGQSELAPISWVEVLTDGRWESFDPHGGYAGVLPHTFVPVRRDGEQVVWGVGAEDLNAEFTLTRLPSSRAAHPSGERRDLAQILDLTRLPLETHEVLSLLLLIPLGALVTSVFRTIVGVDTFGTFTPTLLALSFVYNDWRTGLVVFAVCLALGLASRSVLDRLKLLLVPRLSVVLTLVVVCIVFCVSILDYLHITPSAQAVLLPMVILTMIVERFYVTAEEDGARWATMRLASTVAVACCCYLVLRWVEVGRLLLTYPEIHLATLGLLVALGRYTGYRLTELWRFRDMSRNE